MSYRITMDGQAFCSSTFEQTSVIDPVVNLEVNKAGTFTFTMLPDHPMYNEIDLRQSIFDVELNGELIFEGVAVSEDTDFYNRKTITCEGELTFLNDTIQRQAKYTNQTVASLLGAYLNVHNSEADATKKFSLGNVTVDGGNSILRYTNFTNTMTEIGEDLIDNFGGFLRVRHSGGYRYLDYLAESPRTSSQIIRIGRNLIDLQSNLSSLDLITVLIPLGAKIEGEQDVQGLDKRLDIKSVNSNKDYLIGTAASWYGYVWGTQTWDGVTTASALKTKGQEYLEDVQWANLVISATALDLGLTDEDVEQFRLLDTIRVISEPHGIDRNFILSKLQIDLNHPANTQITLGIDQRLSLSARSMKNSDQIQLSETRIMTNASENAKQILESSTDGNIYFKFDDVTGKCYEIDIMDTNDPSTAQRIWRWNLGGWGYSNDGGQTYTVAATMDGAILASLITTGILKSDDGTTFYLDLDNGILKGNFTELKIAGSAGATQAYADQAEADAVSTASSNTSTAISNYDTNLNQLKVFNKLTNNGTAQGIFLDSNGDLYVNGTYIQAHTVAVNKLTGTVNDSGNTWQIDFDNGTFTIGNISANNITTGTLSADRIDTNTIAISKLTSAAQAALVSSTTVKNQYYLSTSSSSATGGSWSDTVPTWSSGKYVWTRVSTTETYASGTSSTTTSTAVYDRQLTTALSTASSASSAASTAQTTANGAVKSTVSVYYRSTTSTTPTISTSTTIGTSATTDNAWEYVMPRPKNGCYFFTCERYTYNDNTVGFSTVRQMSNLTYTSLWCSANDASYIDGSAIYAHTVTANQISVSDLSAFNATIGAFTIDSNSIYSGTKGSGTANGDITLTTSTFSRSIGGTNRSNLKFAIGGNFGVAQDGSVYMSNATITSGLVNITSTSSTVSALSVDYTYSGNQQNYMSMLSASQITHKVTASNGSYDLVYLNKDGLVFGSAGANGSNYAEYGSYLSDGWGIADHSGHGLFMQCPTNAYIYIQPRTVASW